MTPIAATGSLTRETDLHMQCVCVHAFRMDRGELPQKEEKTRGKKSLEKRGVVPLPGSVCLAFNKQKQLRSVVIRKRKRNIYIYMYKED